MHAFISGFAQQLYLSAEDGITQASQDGADYWYIDGSLPEEYPEQWTATRIKSMRTMIKQLNVKPIYHGNFKAPLASDVTAIRNTAINYIKTEVDLAAQLSAPLIIHGGAIVEPRLVIKAKQEAIANYLRSLEEIIPYAEQQGVLILLENLSNYKNYRPFHYIFTTPEEYKYIFEHINHPNVAFFFDVGHGAICDGDPTAVIKQFHHKIWGMSFSNNDGVRDLHLNINQGLIDYYNVINTIIACQWRGVIAFEVRGRDFKHNINDVEKIYASLSVQQTA